jgi:hypothetical protein
MVSACRLRGRIRYTSRVSPGVFPVALTDRGQAVSDRSRGALLAAALVMAVRYLLVRRGLMPPLSMRAAWTPR